MKVRRIALFYCQSEANATLSYQHGWPRAFVESPLLECVPFNLANRSLTDALGMAKMLCCGRFDAIVLLHSVFSNAQKLRWLLFMTVAGCRLPKLFFIGNEYKLMPEKIRFCRRLGVDMLISQSNDPRVLALYEAAVGCSISSLPNTGLDASIFYPVVPMTGRVVDIGYRAYEAPWYLGNLEKTEIASFFTGNAMRLGLNTDISLDAADRFDSKGYAAFLNRCRGQIGTEAGGDYFELTDATRLKVNAYLSAHPDTAWEEVESRFFAGYGEAVPMRIISGRQVEAAACKTVQILFEGGYSGYLQPEEHYIPLKKDYSNIDDVMRKFRDDSYCRKLVDAAFEVAMTEFTYERLVAKFVSGPLRSVV